MEVSERESMPLPIAS